MDYRERFREENEAVAERFTLSFDRIAQIVQEHTVSEPFEAYFVEMARFLLRIRQLAEEISEHRFDNTSEEQLHRVNHELYGDIEGSAYDISYANPAYATKMLGDGYGRLCAFLYRELRSCIAYAYEYRMEPIVIRCELFIEIYNCFEGRQIPPSGEIHDILYWFASDYSDEITEYRIRETLDPQLSFAKDIISHADLTDVRYLYRFGEYISENELETARFLAKLPQEDIDRMADTFTEGFRMGFENSGKDLSIKKTVDIRYHLGFERVIKKAVDNFHEMGLESIICRRPVDSITSGSGYEGAHPNKQYAYDHREDRALFLDKAYVERYLGVLKTAYEANKEAAAVYAGPAVMEAFGETPFAPEVKKEAYRLNEKQQKLAVELANAKGSLVNDYIHEEERSFTIIAFPLPEIGEPYEEIFREIIRINTLDYKMYQNVQQTLIDALDKGTYVLVKGRGSTDLRIQLYPLRDKDKETIFENCVADVNIPVGEVFTSPVLKRTDGVLYVSKVYLNELEYRDLKIVFKDGMVVDYGCSNFDDADEGRAYIRRNVLKHNDSLPMGEFAIGTNTTAYAAARKYGLEGKFPILIAEKTGPHFALGDTCYSRAEDVTIYNPDGREIVAKENEISALRHEDANKAYFNCHTDITIPYDELGSICVVCEDGTHIMLIEDGRFVLEGTQFLNEPLAP